MSPFDPNTPINVGDVVELIGRDGSIMHVISVEGDDVDCVGRRRNAVTAKNPVMINA